MPKDKELESKKSKNQQEYKNKEKFILGNKKVSNPHDSYFKNMMQCRQISQEFLAHYLNPKYKALVDLSTIHVEQESFIDEELQKSYCDVLFSVKTNNKKDAFIYTVLVEHQAKVDYWFMLRLMKYIISICEKYKAKHDDKKVKLPLIFPILVSNASKPFDAPLEFAGLFDIVEIARESLARCHLVDLYTIADDDILKHKAMWIMEYCLKHARDRDKVKVFQEVFKKLETLSKGDKEKMLIYLSPTFCYIMSISPEKSKNKLHEILIENLSKQEKENIMRTVEDAYIEELQEKLRPALLQEGMEKGIEKGMQKEAIKVATKMSKDNEPIDKIAKYTGLSKDKIFELHKKLEKELEA